MKLAKNFSTGSLLIVTGFTTGCATLTQGSTDTVTVDTRPPGAVCELRQGGAMIAAINPTPGSITVPKSNNDLAVRCTKAGYLPTAGVLGSEFAPMTFGNILFGGIIGVAIDAASGAMTNYPPIITLTLEPEQFGTVSERDRFFDDLRRQSITEYDEATRRIRQQCGNDASNCQSQLQAAEQGHEGNLRLIEDRRRTAKVAS